jgi:hypothetical protein
MSTLNWSALDYSPLTRTEISVAVLDPEWQDLRRRMLLTRLVTRYAVLKRWLEMHENSRTSQVQVSNYISALKRGGMIK